MQSWRIAEARCTGTSHRESATPCQDWHLVDFISPKEDSEWILIAVADGAGSAPRSDEGAMDACKAAILHLKEHADQLASASTAESCMHDAFRAATEAIFERAAFDEIQPRDLACTLLVTAVGEEFSVFGQVGDGAIIWGTAEDLEVAHWPDQPALNVTDFLTSGDLEQTLHLGLRRGATARVACMTDGLAPVLLELRSRRAHAPAFDKFFKAMLLAPDPSELSDQLSGFIDSPGVNERTDDDKTLVLALRGDPVRSCATQD